MEKNFWGQNIVTDEEAKKLEWYEKNDELINFIRNNNSIYSKLETLKEIDIEKYIYELIDLNDELKLAGYERTKDFIKTIEEVSKTPRKFQYLIDIVKLLQEILESDSLHLFVKSSQIAQLQEAFEYIKEEDIDSKLSSRTNELKTLMKKINDNEAKLEEVTSKLDKAIDELNHEKSEKDKIEEVTESLRLEKATLEKEIEEKKEILKDDLLPIKNEMMKKLTDELENLRKSKLSILEDEKSKLEIETETVRQSINILLSMYSNNNEGRKVHVAKNKSCTYEFVKPYGNFDFLDYKTGNEIIDKIEKNHAEKTGLSLNEASYELKRNCEKLYFLCEYIDNCILKRSDGKQFNWNDISCKEGITIYHKIMLYPFFDYSSGHCEYYKVNREITDRIYSILDDVKIPVYYDLSMNKIEHNSLEEELLRTRKELILEKAKNKVYDEMQMIINSDLQQDLGLDNGQNIQRTLK